VHQAAKALLFLVALCQVSAAWAQGADPAQVAIGERLFLETRFLRSLNEDYE